MKNSFFFTNHEHFMRRYWGYFCRWWWEVRFGGALTRFTVVGARRTKARLSLRQGTAVGESVLHVSVGICV